MAGAFTTPIWAQVGTYGATTDRLLVERLFQGLEQTEGFFVYQHASGANFSVDVAPGWAAIKGDDSPGQRMYLFEWIDLVTPVTLPVVLFGAPSGTGPRIDLLTIQVYDTNAGGSLGPPDGSGGNKLVDFAVVVGTPNTVGGAPVVPALPNSAVKLAEILRPVGSTGIATAHITQKQPVHVPVMLSAVGPTVPGRLHGDQWIVG